MAVSNLTVLRTRASRIVSPAALLAITALLVWTTVSALIAGAYVGAAAEAAASAVYVFILVRQRRTGVVLEPEAIVRKGLLRTSRTAWADIVDVRTLPNLGFWARGAVVRSSRNQLTRRVALPGIVAVAARRKDPPELIAIKEAWITATGRQPSNFDAFGSRVLGFAGRMSFAIGIGALVGSLVTWPSTRSSPWPFVIWGLALISVGVAASVWRQYLYAGVRRR